jgi:hypothetical protein
VLPLGLGLETMDQALPFHDSTRVWAMLPLEEYPTAVQFAALRQDAPKRAAKRFPLSVFGLGLATIDQALPFHDSTKVP